ncbi:MAG: tRNA (adenosine(37)-N6)-threonylcarbamoyltransferase complex transferase subunit TsaD [Vicinamibacterales bacterium]
MIILGIESSCDETAAAVLEETGQSERPWSIRSSIVASQVAIHREWGGVVPEMASRQHLRDICGVVEKALADGGVGFRDLGAVAVTRGPGLIGSLLVGVAFAKSIAATHGLPLIGVHHLAGHIESLVLHAGPMPLPAVVLVVSGGHTNLYFVPAEGEYRLIGRTRDDAAGEAYDKVAKLLNLGYPGGPIVDKRARRGNDRAVSLPTTRLTHPDRVAGPPTGVTGAFEHALRFRTDFSFSGLKTAVLRHVKHRRAELQEAGDGPELPDQEIDDMCASFQRVVVEALLDRTFDAAEWFGARSIGISGGVSANSRLRHDAQARGARVELPVFLPSLALSTDNAAMIAAAGLRRFREGNLASLDMNADAGLTLP